MACVPGFIVVFSVTGKWSVSVGFSLFWQHATFGYNKVSVIDNNVTPHLEHTVE